MKKKLRIAIFLFVSVFFLFLLLLFYPYRSGSLQSDPKPAASYEEALQRIDSFRKNEHVKMNDCCRTIVLTHGARTQNAAVFFHGYTNCPEQFRKLGQVLYDSGFNVLILPMRYHGWVDRLSEEHALLTAEYLAGFADESIDMAQGLGDRVVVAGLSLGGILAAWAAQCRSDVDAALVMAPSIGFKSIPRMLTVPVTNLFGLLPNSFIWWDDKKKGTDGPQYAYPRFSTRALYESLRMGFALQSKAAHQKPLASKILVVTNAADKAVNNESVKKLADAWIAHGASVDTFEFPERYHLNNDLIDPNQPDQRIDVVYPVLVRWVMQEMKNEGADQ